jgi:hypothetical protein
MSTPRLQWRHAGVLCHPGGSDYNKTKHEAEASWSTLGKRGRYLIWHWHQQKWRGYSVVRLKPLIGMSTPNGRSWEFSGYSLATPVGTFNEAAAIAEQDNRRLVNEWGQHDRG